jgi:hypothetical protein
LPSSFGIYLVFWVDFLYLALTQGLGQVPKLETWILNKMDFKSNIWIFQDPFLAFCAGLKENQDKKMKIMFY